MIHDKSGSRLVVVYIWDAFVYWRRLKFERLSPLPADFAGEMLVHKVRKRAPNRTHRHDRLCQISSPTFSETE